MVAKCHYKLVQITEYTTPRVKLNVNYRLWMKWCVYMGSSIVKNVPLWWVMLIMREAIYVWGAAGIWDISVPFTQFCGELKTALKIIYMYIDTDTQTHTHVSWKRACFRHSLIYASNDITSTSFHSLHISSHLYPHVHFIFRQLLSSQTCDD